MGVAAMVEVAKVGVATVGVMAEVAMAAGMAVVVTGGLKVAMGGQMVAAVAMVAAMVVATMVVAAMVAAMATVAAEVMAGCTVAQEVMKAAGWEAEAAAERKAAGMVEVAKVDKVVVDLA